MPRGLIKEDNPPSFPFSSVSYSLIILLPLGITEKSSRSTVFSLPENAPIPCEIRLLSLNPSHPRHSLVPLPFPPDNHPHSAESLPPDYFC